MRVNVDKDEGECNDPDGAKQNYSEKLRHSATLSTKTITWTAGKYPDIRSESPLKSYRNIQDVTLKESEGRSAVSVLWLLYYGLVFILLVFAQRRGRGRGE
jgi:hypothetical protein